MKTLKPLAVSLVLALMPIMGAKASVMEIYVFGDSLSDTGNLLALTAGTVPPSPPYFDGRASNGPIWTDSFAADLGLAVNNMWAPGATPGAGKLNNYAVGGAFTNQLDLADTGPVANSNARLSPLFSGLPGLQQQVGSHALLPGESNPDAWYVVWAGANDLIFSFDAMTLPNDTTLVDSAIMNIRDALELLASDGAEHFLVPNLPDLGATPFAKGAPAPVSLLLTQGTDLFNQGLAAMLADVAAAFALDITLVDLHAIFDSILAGLPSTEFPGEGISPLEPPGLGPCFNQETGMVLCDLTVAGAGNGNVFWDVVHPSSRTHGLIGDAILAAKISEPAAITLLALGLIGVAYGSRRRTV